MNKFYVIFPLAALIGFAVYYSSFHSQFEAKLEADKARAEATRAQEEKEKKEKEEIAAREAQAVLQKSRDDEAAAKQKKRDEQKAKDDAVLAETEKLEAEGKALSVELGQVQAKLAEMRRSRSKLQNDAFELAHQVELMKIERRTAENEIQRATQMLADRVGASSMADATFFANPVPPSAKTPAK